MIRIALLLITVVMAGTWPVRTDEKPVETAQRRPAPKLSDLFGDEVLARGKVIANILRIAANRDQRKRQIHGNQSHCYPLFPSSVTSEGFVSDDGFKRPKDVISFA